MSNHHQLKRFVFHWWFHHLPLHWGHWMDLKYILTPKKVLSPFRISFLCTKVDWCHEFPQLVCMNLQKEQDLYDNCLISFHHKMLRSPRGMGSRTILQKWFPFDKIMAPRQYSITLIHMFCCNDDSKSTAVGWNGSFPELGSQLMQSMQGLHWIVIS